MARKALFKIEEADNGRPAFQQPATAPVSRQGSGFRLNRPQRDERPGARNIARESGL